MSLAKWSRDFFENFPKKSSHFENFKKKLPRILEDLDTFLTFFF
jgi:hypothetical protein